MTHAEYAKYTEGLITPYRQDVFDKLLRQISNGSVCDLGSHSVGHYWALGYAERVEEITFYDVCEEALAIQQRIIDTMTPENLVSRYEDTLSYLKTESITIGDAEQAALAIQENVIEIKRFDFLQDTSDMQFDYVLAFESLEVVNDLSEFEQAVKAAQKLLKPDNAKLFAIIIPYAKENNHIENLRQLNLGGKFSPTLEEIEQTFNNANFQSVSIITIPTNLDYYPNAYFITGCN